MNLIIFTLFGLGLGGLYAMLGAGIVVAYKGSGVINFAHGAMAMYVAFTFERARCATGKLRLPLDRLPADRVASTSRSRSASSDGPLSFWPAFLVAMLHGGAARPRGALPGVPAAAQRSAARQGDRVGRGAALPPGHRGLDYHFGVEQRRSRETIVPDEAPQELPRDAARSYPPQHALPRRHRRARSASSSGPSTGTPASGSPPGPRPATRRAPCSSATRPSSWPPPTGCIAIVVRRLRPPSSSGRSRGTLTADPAHRAHRSGARLPR